MQRAGAGDSILEGDSTNGLEDQSPRTNLQLVNATLIQRRTGDQVLRLRGGMDATFANTVVVDQSTGTPCLRIDQTQTTRAANAGLDENGPPVFRSTVLSCATPFRAGSSGVTLEATRDIFNAGTNNNSAFTATLSMSFANGANETAVPAFNPTSLSSFFEAVSYIGAIQNAADTRFQGWTCDSAAATFGGTSNTGACTSLPVYS